MVFEKVCAVSRGALRALAGRVGPICSMMLWLVRDRGTLRLAAFEFASMR